MASFLHRVFGKFLAPRVERVPAVYLAAFGKHPGWNDHMDDLGLETERLVAAKRLLYLQGIASNIDSGAWDNLPPGGAMPDFGHEFIWVVNDDVLAGRMWPSSDGRGRTRYPMVACAQCSNVGVEWALREVLPALAALQAQCTAARSADEVRAALDGARLELRTRVATLQSEAPAGAPVAGRAREAGAAAVVDLLHCAGMGSDHAGVLRVLYQMQSHAPQLRVPSCTGPAADVFLRWHRFLSNQVSPRSPVLMLAPDQRMAGDGGGWVDLIFGEPAPAAFFCLRATPKTVPLTSDIPYTLDPSFVAGAEAYLAECQALKAMESKAG